MVNYYPILTQGSKGDVGRLVVRKTTDYSHQQSKPGPRTGMKWEIYTYKRINEKNSRLNATKSEKMLLEKPCCINNLFLFSYLRQCLMFFWSCTVFYCLPIYTQINQNPSVSIWLTEPSISYRAPANTNEFLAAFSSSMNIIVSCTLLYVLYRHAFTLFLLGLSGSHLQDGPPSVLSSTSRLWAKRELSTSRATSEK